MSLKTSITMSDVASLAGVSLITVSRVLKQPEKVAERTRERVMKAIEETGYVPNDVAGSLASRRTRLVAALMPTITNSIFADTVAGLGDELRPAGYQLLLGVTGYSVATETDLVAAALAQRPAGLVLTGLTHTERTEALVRNAHIPVVETWNTAAAGLDMTVGFSNRIASAAMVERLIELGYRRIGYVGAPVEANDRALDRLSGYRDAMEVHGLDVVEGQIRHASFDFASGAEAIRALRHTVDGLDAVFCANDIIAIGALLECQRLGVTVPDELAIAGFDDVELASQVNPSLTTVRLPRYEIGREAARLLIKRFDASVTTSREVNLGFEIIERGSTPAHGKHLG